MPKVTDIKAYWRELATKAGLKEDELKQVAAVMDNDNFAKAFQEGFKPLPDYSHDLDDVRTKTKAEKDKEYNDWYVKEQAKYQEYLASEARNKQYEEIYGKLDVTNPPNPQTGGKAMTQEEIDRLVETKLATSLKPRDAAYLDYLELREDHMEQFGKRLNRAEFEKAMREHPEWGGNLKLGYQQWIGPELEKAKEAKAKADSDRRYEEGVRDGYSRRAVPTDHQPKQFSPMFDQKADVLKMSEREQESHSRQAFFEGLREANKPS